MARVMLTTAAVAHIRDTIASSQFEFPVLAIGHVPGRNELRRAADGGSQWHVTDVDEWMVQVFGAERPAVGRDSYPFLEVPMLALECSREMSEMKGNLIVDEVRGELSIAGIAI